MPNNKSNQSQNSKGLLCWDIDGVLVDELPWENDWRSGFSPEARQLYQALDADERWQSCLRGESRACDILSLLAHETKVSTELPDEVLKLWHGREVKLNTPLLALMGKMKGQGWQNIIASNQDKDRAEVLRKFLPVTELVKGWGFSCDLGAAKPNADFYQAIISRFGGEGETYVMIDDTVANLKVPNDIGWKTHHYKNLAGVTSFLESL